MSPSELASRFVARFHRKPAARARAPGRVNLIGEHTDYNDGFVLPIAIEQSLWAAAAPRDDGRLHVYSDTLNDEQTWKLDDGPAPDAMPWSRYVHGVADLLRKRGAAGNGADLYVTGDLPLGGGLSSSAALEVSTSLSLAAMAFHEIAPLDLADLCRSAENHYAGVPCGIMDQFASLLCRRNHALLLDCRSREYRHIPFEAGSHQLLLVDSGVRHALATGEYALRRHACQHALRVVRTRLADAEALRDVTPADLRRHGAEWERVLTAQPDDGGPQRRTPEPHVAAPPPDALGRPMDSAQTAPCGASSVPGEQVFACLRHVVTENERTLAAADALGARDWARLGSLMRASHASLRDDYRVSCRELDELVERRVSCPGVRGARMTGGGFGGCVVALVEASAGDQVMDRLRDSHRTHRALWVRPAAGAEVL